jgi:hypothetical protein
MPRKLNKHGTVNIFSLLGLLFVISLITGLLFLDKNDWECRGGPYSRGLLSTSMSNQTAVCNGDGMPTGYSGSALMSMTTGEVVKNVSLHSKAETRSVKWRRAAALALIICSLVTIVTENPNNDPWKGVGTTRKFGVLSVLIFTVLYFYFNWHSYHRLSPIEARIDTGLEILKARKL